MSWNKQRLPQNLIKEFFSHVYLTFFNQIFFLEPNSYFYLKKINIINFHNKKKKLKIFLNNTYIHQHLPRIIFPFINVPFTYIYDNVSSVVTLYKGWILYLLHIFLFNFLLLHKCTSQHTFISQSDKLSHYLCHNKFTWHAETIFVWHDTWVTWS